MATDLAADEDEPAAPRKPAEASVDEAVGCVGRTIGVLFVLFLLLGSVIGVFVLRC